MNSLFQTIRPGTKTMTEIRIPGYDYSLPATLIDGAETGKTVLITAGMHSGEYPGIPASFQAAEQIDPAKTSGRILFIHCLNPSGFRARTDNYVPEDGKNMNRIFPTDQSGTPADQIVSFISGILPDVDFVVDLHSGGLSEILTDHLYFPKNEPARSASLSAAKKLQFPYLTASCSLTGEIGYAGNVLGIPGLLLERGHSGYCLTSWTEQMREDILSVLGILGLIEYEPGRPVLQTIFENAVYTEAQTEGLWYPFIRENEKVRRGQMLGEIRSFRNEVLQTVTAEADGIVLYFTPGLSIVPGWPLAAYGILEKFSE